MRERSLSWLVWDHCGKKSRKGERGGEREGRKGKRGRVGEGRMSGIENQQISAEGSYRIDGEGHTHSPVILCKVVQLAHSFPHLVIQVQHSGCKV